MLGSFGKEITQTDQPNKEGEELEVIWGPPGAFHFAYCTEAIANAKPMDLAAFLVEVTRRGADTDTSADPLGKAIDLLNQIAPTAEGQALRRVIRALATKDGAFRESDVYLFSAPTLALICALIDARTSGLYRQEEWQRGLGR